MTEPRQCPAVLIAAPASGQGKTTVTAALARLHRNQGRRVRVFKCGPDFLDPMILARASGAPVYQLDMWMVGEQDSRRLLWEAAEEADIILIEGVMGLFDGTPSSADLARHFGVPVLAVIDGTAMAQTFGALALGLACYQPDLPFAGVLANRVGTVRHAQLLEGSLTQGLRWYGALSRKPGSNCPAAIWGWCRPASSTIWTPVWMPRPQPLRRPARWPCRPRSRSPSRSSTESRGCSTACASPWPAMPLSPSSMTPASVYYATWAPSWCSSRRCTMHTCQRATAFTCPAATRSCITWHSPRILRCSPTFVPITQRTNRCWPNAAACFTCSTR